MKAVMVAASKQQEENMTRIITQSELQCLNDVELRSVYYRVLNDLSRHDLSIEEHSMLMLSLQNVRWALQRRKPRGPGL